jgi:hypothetical protein
MTLSKELEANLLTVRTAKFEDKLILFQPVVGSLNACLRVMSTNGNDIGPVVQLINVAQQHNPLMCYCVNCVQA